MVMGVDSIKDLPPRSAKKLIRDQLASMFPKIRTRTGSQAVSLTMDGVDMQLVPVLKIGNVRYIISETGRGWRPFDPAAFDRSFDSADKETGGKIRDTVRIIKVLQTALEPHLRLSGHHLEACVLRYAMSREETPGLTNLVRGSLEFIANNTTVRIPDLTGQADFVDDEFGPSYKRLRLQTAERYRGLVRTLDDGIKNGSLEDLREIMRR